MMGDGQDRVLMRETQKGSTVTAAIQPYAISINCHRQAQCERCGLQARRQHSKCFW